jgi:fibronectin-binding autotransporter adhesin
LRTRPASDASAPPLVLTFATTNLFTGARSVLIGSSIFQSSDAANSSKVVFLNANNYTLGTTIFAGALAVGHDNALGSGAVTITGGGSLEAEGGPRTVANPIVFSAPAGSSFLFGGTNDLTLRGTVNLGGVAHKFNGGYQRTTFGNTISNGTLTLEGGIWSLTGTNTFLGGLTLSGAVLDLSHDRQLGAVGSTLTLDGGRLRPSVPLTTSRPVTLTNSGGTIETNGQTLTLTGAVSGTLNGALTKEGPGTLVLSGRGKTGFLILTEGTVRFE